MAKHRAVKKTPDPARPALYEVAMKSSLDEFVQANNAALIECAFTQARARAQIKAPGRFFKQWRLKKNAALEKQIALAAARADSVRDALQRGARAAFHEGQPEKIQLMLAEPEKFVYARQDLPHGEATYKAEQLIQLMFWSKTPAAVPALALAKVPAGHKQGTLDHTLYRLVNAYNKFEPLTLSLLQAGAKPSGLILADAVRKNASPTLVEQFVRHGASFESAFEVINNNPVHYGDTAQKLAAIRDTLAQQNQPPQIASLTQLQENKIDAMTRIGKPRAPSAGSPAKHRKPLRKFE